MKVEIYTKPGCSYCHRAKMLLSQKAVQYEEIDLSLKPERYNEMLSRSSGRRTVPQIFIDRIHIGGCDDLYALDKKGKLDQILKGDK